MTASGDLAVVRREGRIVALQTSLALAVMLVLVGAIVSTVYIRSQNAQIAAELEMVAMAADDANDPPPGMALVLRTDDGKISVSEGGGPGMSLLSGPAGLTDIDADGRHYRALVVDRPEGRVVTLVDLAPFRASRGRLLTALGFAELVGVLASIAVVIFFSRRSIRPLVKALALQRRFVADASHELRAPLTVLHTRAQLVARRLHSGDLPAAREAADAMVDDSRVLAGVVDDLLASATMVPARLERNRVDLAAVAGSVCRSMEAHAATAGVRLVYRNPGGSAEVMGSEAALRRALTALTDNALQHEHAGGRVELAVRRDGQNVIAAVTDDGSGIDAPTMETLFNRFSRGARAVAREGRASYGIGLALVREIVESHGGDIRVSSTPGRGTTFVVTLPAAPLD